MCWGQTKCKNAVFALSYSYPYASFCFWALWVNIEQCCSIWGPLTCIAESNLNLLYTSKWAVWNDALLSFRNQCYAGVQLNSCLSGTLLESNDQVKVAEGCSSRFAQAPAQYSQIWDTQSTRPFSPFLPTVSISKTCSTLCPTQVLWPLWTKSAVPDTF